MATSFKCRATGVIRTHHLRSQPYTTIPGDQRRELTAPATDETGREWPTGTVFTPLCGGSDGTGGSYTLPNTNGAGVVTYRVEGRYAEVTISGRRVKFRF